MLLQLLQQGQFSHINLGRKRKIFFFFRKEGKKLNFFGTLQFPRAYFAVCNGRKVENNGNFNQEFLFPPFLRETTGVARQFFPSPVCFIFLPCDATTISRRSKKRRRRGFAVNGNLEKQEQGLFIDLRRLICQKRYRFGRGNIISVL